MLFTELISQLKAPDQGQEAKQLLRILEQWKKNDQPISTLQTSVNKFLALNENVSETIQSTWKRFESESILFVDGMTMNERLFVFNLFNRWDRCKTMDHKLKLYAKVHAHP